MSELHHNYWPSKLPRKLTLPKTSIYYNLEVSANRYPDKTFIHYYGNEISFSKFRDQTLSIAGFLQQRCHIKKGDRVLLYMQNCPQYMIGYYAILRANAVVVPVNPMNMEDELKHYIEDSGANTILLSQDLIDRVIKFLDDDDSLLKHVISCCYKDYLPTKIDVETPDFLKVPNASFSDNRITNWSNVINQNLIPGPECNSPHDLCVMPYTSGTTGKPKGCIHTHETVMATVCASESWFSAKADESRLAVLPMYHVTGMQGGMNCPMYTGSTIVLLSRWDRDLAAKYIEKYRIAVFSCIPTMVVDFLANPNLDRYDISSLRRMNGGGTAMPAAIAQKLETMGITFIEGYGLSETIAPTHYNPPDRAKKQCLGIPIFGVDSLIVDPTTLKEVKNGDVGEILISGPQVFKGYWNNSEATGEALVQVDGKTFLRTGDLAREDEEGYFFMIDRLKRMINASGFKVWPAEVELMLYKNPLVHEACVISRKDPYRGETVKALIVLKKQSKDKIKENDIIQWAAKEMAAYKAPKIVEFVDHLPKSASGKILWRKLQDIENSKNL
jgi:fatty-acyl-CoA synthase